MNDTLDWMVVIPSGDFILGSDSFYPEESPVRSVQIKSFRIDACPVTNADFARFVSQTGYVTVSEKPPDPVLYPNLPPDQQNPESAVFIPPPPTVDRNQPMSGKDLSRGRTNRLTDGFGRLLWDRFQQTATALLICAAMFGSGPPHCSLFPKESRSVGSSRGDPSFVLRTTAIASGQRL
jgi:hypothetical protein